MKSSAFLNLPVIRAELAEAMAICPILAAMAAPA